MSDEHWYPISSEINGYETRLLVHANVDAESDFPAEIYMVIDLDNGRLIVLDDVPEYEYFAIESEVFSVGTNMADPAWKGLDLFKEAAFPRRKDA